VHPEEHLVDLLLGIVAPGSKRLTTSSSTAARTFRFAGTRSMRPSLNNRPTSRSCSARAASYAASRGPTLASTAARAAV
jgi:hypothetical protein